MYRAFLLSFSIYQHGVPYLVLFSIHVCRYVFLQIGLIYKVLLHTLPEDFPLFLHKLLNFLALLFQLIKGFMGPTGVGFMYGHNFDLIDPIFQGGTGKVSSSRSHPKNLEEKYSAGTQNMTSIAGLYGSLKYRDLKVYNDTFKKFSKLRELFFVRLSELEEIIIYSNGDKDKKVPIVSFNIKNSHPLEIASFLDKNEICVRSGLHCAPICHEQLGNINGSIRVSFSIFNSEADVDRVTNELKNIIFNKKYVRINC